jgi:hypothetical protein
MRKVLLFLSIFTVSFLPALSCQAQSQRGDILFQTGFNSAAQLKTYLHFDAKKMQLDKSTSPSSLRVECPTTNGISDAKLSIPLPIKKLRGMRVKFSATVKAQDVAKPAYSYNGVKVMLNIVLPNGQTYPQLNGVRGTFDWKRIQWEATIPANATAVYLVLGLENTTGTAWFNDVRISLVKKLRNRPAQPVSGPVYTGHPGIPRLRGAMIPANLSSESAHVLGKEWNANLVRYQLLWHGYGKNEADLQEGVYDKWLDKKLDELDAFLIDAKKDGLMVVIDLHTPPGGRSSNTSDRIFQEKKYQDMLLTVWNKISRRYKSKKIIWGYDLVNEPIEGMVSDDLLDWHDLATKVAQTIRHNDPDHAIIVEPANGDLNYFESLGPIPVSGVVYSFHIYDPFPYTNQGISKPVGLTYPSKQWNKDTLRETLHPIIQFQHDYNVHIYIGEAGVVRWAPGAAQWLSDVLDIFEENGWDWTYHAFREWQGWSVELSANQKDLTPSTTPTDRQKVILSWFAKNQKPRW